MANGNISIPPSVQGRAGVPTQSVQPIAPPQPPAPRTPNDSIPDPGSRVESFTNDQLRDVASAFGDVVSIVNRGIRVEIDNSSNQVITQIVDRNTDEVIRQIPPEELLRVTQRLRDFIGNILDEQG